MPKPEPPWSSGSSITWSLHHKAFSLPQLYHLRQEAAYTSYLSPLMHRPLQEQLCDIICSVEWSWCKDHKSIDHRGVPGPTSPSSPRQENEWHAHFYPVFYPYVMNHSHNKISWLIEWHITLSMKYCITDVTNWLQPVWSWWRHQMETFSILLALCVGNSPANSLHKIKWCELWCFLWCVPEQRVE